MRLLSFRYSQQWSLLVLLLLTGCGGGGGGSDSPNHAADLTPASVEGQALLGPIRNGLFELYRIAVDAVELEFTGTTSDGDELDHAGQISLPSDELDREALYLLVVIGGEDIDADDDGEIDPEPTPIAGQFHALISGAQLLTGEWQVNAITEVAYQAVKPLLLGAATPEEIGAALDRIAPHLLADDIDESGAIDRHDLAYWHPRHHADRLGHGGYQLSEVIEAVQRGRASAGAHWSPSSAVIATAADTPIWPPAMEVIGDVGVALSSRELYLFDLSSADPLTVAGSYSWAEREGQFARAVAATASHLYVALSDSAVEGDRLLILDILQLATPALINELTLDYEVERLLIQDQLLALQTQLSPESGKELRLFDLADPTQPQELNAFGSNALFDLSGDRLLYQLASALVWRDLSDPADPTPIGAITLHEEAQCEERSSEPSLEISANQIDLAGDSERIAAQIDLLGPGEATIVEGTLTLTEPMVISGDLAIRGDLVVQADLEVSGSLLVAGYITAALPANYQIEVAAQLVAEGIDAADIDLEICADQLSLDEPDDLSSGGSITLGTTSAVYHPSNSVASRFSGSQESLAGEGESALTSISATEFEHDEWCAQPTAGPALTISASALLFQDADDITETIGDAAATSTAFTLIENALTVTEPMEISGDLIILGDLAIQADLEVSGSLLVAGQIRAEPPGSYRVEVQEQLVTDGIYAQEIALNICAGQLSLTDSDISSDLGGGVIGTDRISHGAVISSDTISIDGSLESGAIELITLIPNGPLINEAVVFGPVTQLPGFTLHADRIRDAKLIDQQMYLLVADVEEELPATRLVVVDLAEPSQPTLLRSKRLRFNPSALLLTKERIYLLTRSGPGEILARTPDLELASLGWFAGMNRPTAHGISAAGYTLMTTPLGELALVDLNHVPAERLEAALLPTEAVIEQLILDETGGVMEGGSAVQLIDLGIDLGDSAAPVLRTRIDAEEADGEVVIAPGGSHQLVGDEALILLDNGVHRWDRASGERLGRLTLSGGDQLRRAVRIDDLLYLLVESSITSWMTTDYLNQGRVLVFDLASAADPQSLAEWEAKGALELFIDRRGRLIQLHRNAIRLFDLENPLAPQPISSASIEALCVDPIDQRDADRSTPCGYNRTGVMQGDLLYRATDRQLVVTRIDGTGAIADQAHLAILVDAKQMAIAGGQLALLGEDGRIELFDISDAQHPRAVTLLDRPGGAQAIASDGRDIYLASPEGIDRLPDLLQRDLP